MSKELNIVHITNCDRVHGNLLSIACTPEEFRNYIKSQREEAVREFVARVSGDEQKPKLLVLNGLMWSDSIGKNLSFDEAKKFAKNCRDGGFTDWRVPTAKELADTIDWENGTNAVGVGNGVYWSSTQSDGTNGRDLYFVSGSSYLNSLTKANGFSVRCVRNLEQTSGETTEDKLRTQGYVEGGENERD